MWFLYLNISLSIHFHFSKLKQNIQSISEQRPIFQSSLPHSPCIPLYSSPGFQPYHLAGCEMASEEGWKAIRSLHFLLDLLADVSSFDHLLLLQSLLFTSRTTHFSILVFYFFSSWVFIRPFFVRFSFSPHLCSMPASHLKFCFVLFSFLEWYYPKP